MIHHLNGRISEILPTKVILDVHGIGFDVNISLNTYTALQGKEEAQLFIYESIREDAWVLYGFASREERDLFLLLITVSGIGSNTARTILSSIPPQELCAAIAGENERLLTNVKGIGKRSAQRIIVELKDKIPALEYTTDSTGIPSAKAGLDPETEEKIREAVQALTMLGFSPAPTKKVVHSIVETHPEISTEDLIKMALKAI